MTIRERPHYELPASELAAWIDRQGANRWWNVDGDPLLTGRLMLPCPGDELSNELRRIGRVLLVQDNRPDANGKGQSIGRDELDQLAGHLGNYAVSMGEKPTWADDRVFLLCWKGSNHEWLLVEDRETTESSRADFAVKGE